MFQFLGPLCSSHPYGSDWRDIPSSDLPAPNSATIVGLVFGTIFAVTGRIWMLMVAHAAFDLTALAIIFWDLESWVAHFVFK